MRHYQTSLRGDDLCDRKNAFNLNRVKIQQITTQFFL